jgi:hypothetical protein
MDAQGDVIVICRWSPSLFIYISFLFHFFFFLQWASSQNGYYMWSVVGLPHCLEGKKKTLALLASSWGFTYISESHSAVLLNRCIPNLSLGAGRSFG